MKVMINPGHDLWLDSGAVNEEYNLRECEIALDIGEKVADYLTRAGGYSCLLMQSDNLVGEGDYSYTYSVCGQANLEKVDLFISIHCDAFNGKARGTTCYVFNENGEAAKCAESISSQIHKIIGTQNRGVKEANFVVLKHTKMPAVLVETAFIDNPEDAFLLMNRKDDFAKAIALGITDYVKQRGK